MNLNSTVPGRKRVTPKPRLPKQSENDIQARITKYLRLVGCEVICTDMMIALAYIGKSKLKRINFINKSKKLGYTVGQSDLIAVKNGKVAFIETKKWETGKTKAVINQTKQKDEQKEFETNIKKHGLPYFLIDSPQAEQKVYDYFK